MGITRRMRRPTENNRPSINYTMQSSTPNQSRHGTLRILRRIQETPNQSSLVVDIPKITSSYGSKVEKSSIEWNKCSFNGGIIVKKDGKYQSVVDDLNNSELINVFRYSDDPMSYSRIGVKSITVDGKLKEFITTIIENNEDPRVFTFKEDLYFSATELTNVKGSKVPKIKLHKLDLNYKPIQTYFIDVGNNNLNNTGWEKNWIFFQHDDELCFVYSLHPFIVFNLNKELKTWQEWNKPNFGHLRGGSNPVFINDYYYMFAHIKTDDNKYRMVILQFNNQLQLIKRSNVLNTLNNFNIVFPMGLIYVRNEQKFHVSVGIEDREQYIVSFSKAEVENQLFLI